MFAQLVSTYHLHPIVDHFTIALLTFGIAAGNPGTGHGNMKMKVTVVE